MQIKEQLENIRKSSTSGTSDDNIEADDTENNVGHWSKCDECEYETSIPDHIQSHKLKHTGQYIWQRGCNVGFKIISELDRQLKIVHGKENMGQMWTQF